MIDTSLTSFFNLALTAREEIVLLVQGLLISGRPVSLEEFIEEMAKIVGARVEFKKNPSPDPTYIHLSEVRVLTAGAPIIIKSRPWRIRADDVSAWAI